MKKQVLTSCGILPALLLVQPRIRQYFTYDYIREKTVEVNQFWQAPEVRYNTDLLTESEFKVLHTSASKKVLRDSINFYSDYPDLSSPKQDFISDIYVGSFQPSELIYSLEYTGINFAPDEITKTYSVTVEHMQSFSYATEVSLEASVETFIADVSTSLTIGFNVTEEQRIAGTTELSATAHRLNGYPYMTLVYAKYYLPVTIQMYKELAPASYIYFKDFRLFLVGITMHVGYAVGPFDTLYFEYGNELVPAEEFYKEIYDMTEFSGDRIEKINESVIN